MAGSYLDIIGTVKSYFQIAIGGVKLKNSSGNLVVRNSADNADASVTASTVNVSGDSIQLNSDAAHSGTDYDYTIGRPTTGMGADLTLTLPATAGTTGQALVTDGSGNLSWAATGDTSLCDKIHSETLAYNTTSPLPLFSTGAADIIDEIEIVIDTPFNGTSTMSYGVSGTTSKYAGTTDIDLTAAAGTAFKIHPNVAAQGIEALIATYSAGGASAGSARIITHFATPAA